MKYKINELTPYEKAFYDVLKFHKGKDVAVKSPELERYLSIKGTAVRQLVNSLRTKGIPVCSDRNGYYIASNDIELSHTISHLKSRRQSIDNAIKGLELININSQ